MARELERAGNENSASQEPLRAARSKGRLRVHIQGNRQKKRNTNVRLEWITDRGKGEATTGTHARQNWKKEIRKGD